VILATSKIEDFDRFWNAFSTKGAEKRKQHGSKGSHVFRDPNDERRVWVVFDWDEEGLGTSCLTPTCRRSLRKAGFRVRPSLRSSPASTMPSPKPN
jgi:hypothetical protein